MGVQYTGHRPLTDLIGEAMSADISTADRVSELLGRSIPWQFPARLLTTVVSHSTPNIDRERVTNAIVAVEYGCLHQYLHAVPAVETELAQPVSTSEYDDDSIAAILDGDLLQSCALSRLTRTADDPKTVERFFQSLSEASVTCYEKGIETSRRSVGMQVAPLAGFAARMAALVADINEPEVDEIERAGTALGKGVPVHTPSGWEPGASDDLHAARRRIGELFDSPGRIEQKLAGIIREEKQLAESHENE